MQVKRKLGGHATGVHELQKNQRNPLEFSEMRINIGYGIKLLSKDNPIVKSNKTVEQNNIVYSLKKLTQELLQYKLIQPTRK